MARGLYERSDLEKIKDTVGQRVWTSSLSTTAK
jgi:hypothetical protein